MQGVTAIDKLKLRVGYGAIVNQNIPLYAYLDRFAPGYYYAFGGKSSSGFAQSLLGERGVEMGDEQSIQRGRRIWSFKERLRCSIDYYYKNTRDMLVPALVTRHHHGKAGAPFLNSPVTC